MTDDGRERIQKVLAGAGVASRRACEELVLAGRVTVNGDVVRRLPCLVDPASDELRVDGERVRGPAAARPGGKRSSHAYILMNKPEHVVCTNVAQTTAGRRQTLAIDLLPPDFRRRVWPVGRLDATSRGLLLLTDDGELTHRLTHPSFGVPKTYRVVCDGEVTPEAADELGDGIFLVDRTTTRGSKTAPATIKIVRRDRERSVLELTIKEGRNRQIRRMLASLGHKVRDLRRTRIGPLQMRELPEGSSRPLTPRELRELRQAVGLGRA
ncbi:MAG: pseudouridine synthase [Planctomycetota bacterium]